MTDSLQLDSENFYGKLQKIHQTWSKTTQTFDAHLLVMGKVSDEPERPHTSDFFLWLLNWEFSDTILLILKDKVLFAVSPKKAKLLQKMTQPASYSGPKLQIVERDLKQETVPVFVKRALEEVPRDIKNVGSFLKDKEDGELTRVTLEELKSRDVTFSEMRDFLAEVNKVKITTELKNCQVASSFVEWTFGKIVDEIEDIIESDKHVKHSQIQKKIENCLDSDQMDPFVKKHNNIDPNFLEYPVPVLIQSGNHFTVNKFQVDSSSDILTSQAVYINVCGKFCDMSAMASRTLLVNPKEEQKQAYMIASDALDTVFMNLKVGKPISSAYNAGSNLILQRNSSLHPHANFGFGIGFNYKEDMLIINAQNQQVVEPGMVFHARITLAGVHKESSRSIIAIGDTVQIQADGSFKVLTEGIQKRYQEISYSLQDSDEEDNKQNGKKNGTKVVGSSGSSNADENESEDDGEGSNDILVQGRTGATVIKSSRLRSKAANQQARLTEMEERKDHQCALQDSKVKELKIRHSRGEIQTATKKERIKKMDTIQAYKSMDEYPKNITPGQIYVDMKRHTVLIPNSPTTFIPFHVSTIKSVSDQVQGQWTFLRINFHIAGGNTNQYPPMEDTNNLWVKELMMKTASRDDKQGLSLASQQIKQCLKQVKDKDIESEAKTAQSVVKLEELVTSKAMRREYLENLVIRPNLIGKKTIGNLEIHQNGLRFKSHKGQFVDICFSNVKHCFFQACAADELIVILHFNLHQGIMLGNKKVNDVQFYKESGIAAEDINFKGGRHKLSDMDELQQEEVERQNRKRLNTKFLQFSKLIEQAGDRNKTKIEVDIPVDDLTFYGCAQKQVVKIRPTKDCLVAISEFPFFVMDVNEIEAVHFERVHFGIKNFDLAIIFKDFITFKRINSIPIEYIEELKSYFDEIGVIYSESLAPFNWNAILTEIRENFDSWLEDGAWKFLQEDENEGELDEDNSSVEEDPNCDYGAEESDGSDDEASDFSEEESSAIDSEEELSEEGLSWDELDKQAEEEDRKNAARRAVERVPPGRGAGRDNGRDNGRRR